MRRLPAEPDAWRVLHPPPHPAWSWTHRPARTHRGHCLLVPVQSTGCLVPGVRGAGARRGAGRPLGVGVGAAAGLSCSTTVWPFRGWRLPDPSPQSVQSPASTEDADALLDLSGARVSAAQAPTRCVSTLHPLQPRRLHLPWSPEGHQQAGLPCRLRVVVISLQVEVCPLPHTNSCRSPNPSTSECGLNWKEGLHRNHQFKTMSCG